MNNSILYIRFVLLLILFTFVNVSLFSHSRYSFRNYNINNGLSQNTVLCILQDNLGFMWFGTKDGLNRFDGTSFKIFRFSPDEDLQGNVFHHILQDKNENIWVATENGIYIYSPRNEKFTRFYLTTDTGENFDGLISDLIQDNAGDIWISVEGKGVLHYNFQNESLAFHPVATLPSGLRMISLGVGINNDVWVFPYGLPPLRIDKMTGQMSEFQLNDNPNFLYELGEVHRIAFDDYNQLLIATSRQGLISINTINRTHRILLDRDAAGNSIFARTWKRIDNQTIWVGTESGIHILNTRNGDVVNLRHNAFITTSLSDNAIYSIYKDRDGGIWVGSYFGGVDYFSMQFNKFELFYPIPYLNSIRGLRVREFHSAPDGNIWIGTEDNGLNLFDPNTAAFLPISATLSSLHTNIHALLADGDYLWVGTFSKGLNRYNLRTGSLTTYVPAEDPNSIRHYSIFALHKDRQNTMWVGTLSGLSIYNREEGSFTHI
ncbi:MAG: hybrid sensor histidine kinase/response regulator, partial [Tannerella sp.]|nr:hybrid sensor histidine kinase/response regulator [Tannerella sp.]